MYSGKVVAITRARLERALNLELRDYSLTEVQDMAYRMKDIVWIPGETEATIAGLPTDIQNYIVNEISLSKIDFGYWFRRYAKFLDDRKNLTVVEPWPSQQVVLDKLAKLEDEGLNKLKVIVLKARQVGETALWEALIAHLVCLNPNTAGIIASDHPDNSLKLWQVMMRIYDNLPGWMQPRRDAKVKAINLHLDQIDSDVQVASGNQKTTIGQGMTVDAAHLTEVSTWERENAFRIDADMIPAFDSSQKHHSIFGLESTGAGGSGNWFHDEWQSAINGTSEFNPIFVAWYMRPNRNESAEGVEFNAKTLNMAERVKREVGVELSREQLAWYQKKRVSAEAKNQLEIFFQEYASTPTEAFQTGFRSIFPIEVVDRVRNKCKVPIGVFEVLPSIKKLRKVDLEEWNRDSSPTKAQDRLLLWENPLPNSIYVISADASYGMVGKDNAAVQVLRVGNRSLPDEQVAEWCGTLSPVDLVAPIWILGHMFSDKYLQLPAKVVVECNPGSPGIVTQVELIRLGYPHFYVWQRPLRQDGAYSNETGWWTTPGTRPLLIDKGVDAVNKGDLLINSIGLTDEMRAFVTTFTPGGQRKVEHAPGMHDDRLLSLFIALYVAHEQDSASMAEERHRQEALKSAPAKAKKQLYELSAEWKVGDSLESEMEKWERAMGLDEQSVFY